jgi:hypothetical protein
MGGRSKRSQSSVRKRLRESLDAAARSRKSKLRFARVTRIYTASVAHSSIGRQNWEYCDGAQGLADHTHLRAQLQPRTAQPAYQHCVPIGLVVRM